MNRRLALAALPLALAGAALAADPPKQDYTPVEFTISGGISLGNYEAGLNWAVVRLLKLHQKDDKLLAGLPAPKMVAVSGASAGNINALIAAIEWCRTDDGGASPLSNAFYDSWIPVGWDGLFAGDRTCVQYCQERQLQDTWAARVGGAGPEACLAACRKDCSQFGGKDCDDGGAAYRADDAVFTRRAFLGVEESFRDAIEKLKYDPACKLAVGITTTKYRPTLLDVTGAPPKNVAMPGEPPRYIPEPYSVDQNGLTIETQRYVTALRAETREQTFGYFEHAFQDDHTLGSYLHLPKVAGSDNRVAMDDVLALTEASSAFPLAFGPRKLRFCKVTSTHVPGGAECVDNERLTYDWFIDGGAFDNVPLGLGYSLTEAMVSRAPVTTPERHFFYIDPDRRRYLSGSADPGAAAAEPTPVYPSLSEVVNLAGNFYQVAGKYELQTVARYVWREDLDKNPTRQPPKLLIAGRLIPIVGSYLYAFGAFLAKPFRTFDFEVGAYDGAYDFARWVCGQEASKAASGGRSEARCILEQLEATYGELGMTRDGAEEPRFVFHALLDRELDTWAKLTPGAQHAELQALAAEAAAWSKKQGYDPAKPPSVALGALMRVVGQLHDEEVAAAAGGPDAKEKAALVAKHRGDFSYFLKQLGPDAFEGYSQDERELLADPEMFTNRASLSILSRERQIEHQQNNVTTTRMLSAAQVAVLSQQSSKILGFEWDPSSIPDDNIFTVGKLISRLLPYRVMYRRPAFTPAGGVDIIDGRWDRLEFIYEPTVGLAPDWALLAPVGLYWQLHPSTLGALAIPGVMWRTHNPWFAGVDLGLKGSLTLAGGETGFGTPQLGAEIGARILGGKLRLSLGMDSFGTPSFSFGIGLVDFNGLLYWAVRIAEGT